MELSIKHFRPPLPREHGAWAMFIVPLWVGVGTAGVLNGPGLLFALTAFGFFLLRYPLVLALKSRAPDAAGSALRWGAIYAALTFSSGAVLMIVSQQWLLIPIGALGMVSLAVYLWYAARRAEMTTAGEWVGIAGLALGAPGAYLVATRGSGLSAAEALATTALALYLLNLLYFGGTVFYIKFKVREQPRLIGPAVNWRARLWAGRATLLYHAMATVIVALFAVLGFVPALAPIAFVPTMCKAIGGVVTQPARLNIRRLGFMEVGFTTIYALIVLLAYRRYV